MYKFIAFTLVAIAAVSFGGNTRDYHTNYNQQRQQTSNFGQSQYQPQQFQTQRQYQPNQQYNQPQQNYQQPQQQYQPQPPPQPQSQYNNRQNFNQQNFNTNNNLRKLTRDDTPEASNPSLTPEYLQAYREFTLSLLRQSYYHDSHEKTGVVAYSTFTVGHLLAVINERVFNVPNAGIQRILRLSDQDVPIAYSGIVNTFLEDPKIEASSYLYTPDPNLQVTPNYPKLHIAKKVLQLHQNTQASGVINDDIKKATHGIIDNLVVPEDPPFNQTAVGVFSNTVYYNGRWVHPFVNVGQRPYHTTPGRTRQVETLELQASLPVTVHQKYSAVAIPLEGGSKHIVLVQPRGTIKQFIRESVADIFLHAPQTWNKQIVRVQVPVLNFTVGRNFVAQLNDLADTELQCPGRAGARDDAVPLHYLQPIVQVYSTFFSADGFELAAANGVQVEREFNVQPDRARGVKSGQTHFQSHDKERHSLDPLDSVQVKTVREIDAANAATHVRSDNEFVFDRPYFLYAHDVKLGAITFTAVKTPVVEHFHRSTVGQDRYVGHNQYPARAARHILTHSDFDEETKEYRWNCGAHNDHEHDHVHEHPPGQGHGHGRPQRPTVQPTTPVPTCAPAYPTPAPAYPTMAPAYPTPAPAYPTMAPAYPPAASTQSQYH